MKIIQVRSHLVGMKLGSMEPKLTLIFLQVYLLLKPVSKAIMICLPSNSVLIATKSGKEMSMLAGYVIYLKLGILGTFSVVFKTTSGQQFTVHPKTEN